MHTGLSHTYLRSIGLRTCGSTAAFAAKAATADTKKAAETTTKSTASQAAKAKAAPSSKASMSPKSAGASAAKAKAAPSSKASVSPNPAGASAAGVSDLGLLLTDIGANLTDMMYQGVYRGKQKHPADLAAVLRRARDAGIGSCIVTAGSVQEAREALAMCQAPPKAADGGAIPLLYGTVGVHPTRCNEFEAEGGPAGAQDYLKKLLVAGREAGRHCVAVGELGLDYDRLQFCEKETQLKYFELQLTGLAKPMALPLFLHCRTSEAAKDLHRILSKHRADLPSPPGVVHSFDGTIEDARAFIDLGFYIGLNGCSLRTAENLEVVKQLPSDRILLETDAPWCNIKATHAGHNFVRSTWEEVKKPEKWEEGKCVKDRCEPCHLRCVLEVIAGCRGQDAKALAAELAEGTKRVFFPREP